MLRRALPIALLVCLVFGILAGPFGTLTASGKPKRGRWATTTTTTVAEAPVSSPSTSTTTPAASTTTAPAQPTTTTSAPTTASSSAAQQGEVVGPWRGTYLPHGWIASAKSSTYIHGAVRELASFGFTHQLHNLGSLDATGVVPRSDYAGLAQWISASRSVDSSQRIVLWVSGSESMHVNNAALHPQIAAHLRQLVSEYEVDGFLLDLEPFAKNNANLVQLLRTVRAELPNTWIGVNAPPNGRWSTDFIRQVAEPVDAISPMFYDTTLTDAGAYSSAVTTELQRYIGAAGSHAALLPSIPAYAANRWHDPTVENIESATAGIAATGLPSAGAAVYWWWQFDAVSRAQWQAATGIS